jgi:hypothetical protein
LFGKRGVALFYQNECVVVAYDFIHRPEFQEDNVLKEVLHVFKNLEYHDNFCLFGNRILNGNYIYTIQEDGSLSQPTETDISNISFDYEVHNDGLVSRGTEQYGKLQQMSNYFYTILQPRPLIFVLINEKYYLMMMSYSYNIVEYLVHERAGRLSFIVNYGAALPIVDNRLRQVHKKIKVPTKSARNTID